MVHLKNILYENGIISCLYSPEDCGEYGIIEYDIANDTFLKLKQTKYENGKKFYIRNIKNKLIQLISNTDGIPIEYNLVIY